MKKAIVFVLLMVLTTLTYSQTYVRYYDNVTAMKAATVPNGALIITSGYYAKNDGGGGKYCYDSAATNTVDNGSIFAPNSGVGRFRAIFERSEIDIRQFGAKMDGVTDDAPAIQTLINFADAYNYLIATGLTRPQYTVFIPAAANPALISHLNLKNCSIKGGGTGSQVGARFQAKVGADTALFTLASPPLQQIEYSGFAVLGNTANAHQHCFVFKGYPQPFPSYTGGFWNSLMENLFIKDFTGAAIYLYAKDSVGDIANQFLSFRRVQIFPATTTGASRAVYAFGQLGQAIFEDCLFEGRHNSNAGHTLVQMISYPQNPTDGVGNVTFFNTTFEATEKAMYTYNVGDVTLSSCWFEDLTKAFDVTAHSRITITHGHVANAANNGGTGYFVNNTNSYVSLTDNSYTGNTDLVVKSSNGQVDGWNFSGNNSPNANWQFPTANVFFQQSVAADSSLSTFFNTTVIVNATTKPIKNIISGIEPQNSLYLIAWGGSITLSSGGNINMTGTRTFTASKVVHLIKTDLSPKWFIVN